MHTAASSLPITQTWFFSHVFVQQGFSNSQSSPKPPFTHSHFSLSPSARQIPPFAHFLFLQVSSSEYCNPKKPFWQRQRSLPIQSVRLPEYACFTPPFWHFFGKKIGSVISIAAKAAMKSPKAILRAFLFSIFFKILRVVNRDSYKYTVLIIWTETDKPNFYQEHLPISQNPP